MFCSSNNRCYYNYVFDIGDCLRVSIFVCVCVFFWHVLWYFKKNDSMVKYSKKWDSIKRKKWERVFFRWHVLCLHFILGDSQILSSFYAVTQFFLWFYSYAFNNGTMVVALWIHIKDLIQLFIWRSNSGTHVYVII